LIGLITGPAHGDASAIETMRAQMRREARLCGGQRSQGKFH